MENNPTTWGTRMSDAQLAQCANQKKFGKISLSTPVFLSGKSHAMARVAMVAQSLEPFLALDLGK